MKALQKCRAFFIAVVRFLRVNEPKNPNAFYLQAGVFILKKNLLGFK